MTSFSKVIDAFVVEPSVEASRMFGSDAIKVHGKVFAMHVKGCLVVKLSRPRAEELINASVASVFDPGHGRPMKQWVAIGPEHEWVPFAREAFVFACPTDAEGKRRASIKGD